MRAHLDTASSGTIAEPSKHHFVSNNGAYFTTRTVEYLMSSPQFPRCHDRKRCRTCPPSSLCKVKPGLFSEGLLRPILCFDVPHSWCMRCIQDPFLSDLLEMWKSGPKLTHPMHMRIIECLCYIYRRFERQGAIASSEYCFSDIFRDVQQPWCF